MNADRRLNRRELRDITAAAERLEQDASDLYDGHVVHSTGKIRPYNVKLEIDSLRKLATRLRRVR